VTTNYILRQSKKATTVVTTAVVSSGFMKNNLEIHRPVFCIDSSLIIGRWWGVELRPMKDIRESFRQLIFVGLRMNAIDLHSHRMASRRYHDGLNRAAVLRAPRRWYRTKTEVDVDIGPGNKVGVRTIPSVAYQDAA
jgi:hypothetical protein